MLCNEICTSNNEMNNVTITNYTFSKWQTLLVNELSPLRISTSSIKFTSVNYNGIKLKCNKLKLRPLAVIQSLLDIQSSFLHVTILISPIDIRYILAVLFIDQWFVNMITIPLSVKVKTLLCNWLLVKYNSLLCNWPCSQWQHYSSHWLFCQLQHFSVTDFVVKK